MFKDYKKINVKINNKLYSLWVSDSHEKRKLGLSNIKKIKDNEGMIFVFDKPCNNPFTMKNTYLHLTMLFLDENFKVLNYYKCKPFQKELIKPDFNYSYVIEIQ